MTIAVAAAAERLVRNGQVTRRAVVSVRAVRYHEQWPEGHG
ncbi:hypothetical protein ACFUAC_02635 [Streptomyces sp. NPDC057148]